MAFGAPFGRVFSPTFDRRNVSGNGLLNALIAYWPGNEASGNALDLHTNGLTLTDTNTVTNNTGLVYALARQYTRASFEFHSRAGDDALLSAGDSDLTIASWVLLDTKPAADTMAISGKHNGLTIAGSEYLISYTNIGAVDRLQFETYFGAATSGQIRANTFGSPSTGQWYLVVGFHNSVANTINIQINNGAVDSVAYSSGMNDTTTPFKIGTAYGGSTVSSKWDGRIGPTMFWKSAAGGGGVLTASQRTALYNGGAGLAYAAFTT